MYNIQIISLALWQGARFARVNVNFVIMFIRWFYVVIVKIWRVFAQEGANMFTCGVTVCTATIKPPFGINGYNARGVTYKMNTTVIVVIYAATTIGTIFEIARVVNGCEIVTIDNFLAIHCISPPKMFFCSLQNNYIIP